MSRSKYTLALFFSTVFLTGAAVLVLEVAAVRLLTPIFGGSVYVLSSVLSVILLALSLGYFIGGRVSDRYPYPLPLYLIISAGGISVLALYFLAVSTLDPTQHFISPFIGPILYSLFFFFVPAFLLGMDSPYVIKLISEQTDPETSGKYVGTTFFWSTVGSICGSLAAGFWLIPTYGTLATILYTGILLVGIGILTPFALQKYYPIEADQRATYIFFTLAIFFGSIGLIWAGHAQAGLPKQTIHAYSGLYSEIRVEELSTPDNRTIRRLRRDTNLSSAVYLDSYDHVFTYSQFADLYPYLNPNTQHVLVLGGGAYTIPRRLAALDKNITIDVVEIEPTLYDLAQEYFDLTNTDRIQNHVSDARMFLTHNNATYDVIFSDTMNSAMNIPFQLTTTEFYALLKSRLAADGALIMNSIGTVTSTEHNISAATYATLKEHFQHVAMYQARPVEPDVIQNVMFIASDIPIPDTINELVYDTKGSGTTTVAQLQIDTDAIYKESTDILTDDHAPVELMLAEQFRKYSKNR